MSQAHAANWPDLAFASPRKLPRPASLRGRVVVVDIAFAADGLGAGFAKTTGAFIKGLDARLARWIDHHDHPMHVAFASDPRFVLSTKAEHGACPEMINEELVRDTGPIDTILAHFDLDGLYSAAKWILGGKEPYAGADDDARAVDTRMGACSARGQLVDLALRAHYADPTLKVQVVRWLVEGCKNGILKDAIASAADDGRAMELEASRLAAQFDVKDDIAVIHIPASSKAFDKTDLLLRGQQIATVAVVVENGNASIAAAFDSGVDFVALLELGGGMPTRVSIPESRLAQALERIASALRQRRSDGGE